MRPPASACSLDPVHRRESALRREVHDRFAGAENIGSRRTRTAHRRAPAPSPRRPRSISHGIPRFHDLKLHPQGPGRGLRCRNMCTVRRLVGIPEDGHPRDLGDDLPEQLQLLSPPPRRAWQDSPVMFAARPREAWRQARPTGSADSRHDDRDRTWSLLGGLSRWRGPDVTMTSTFELDQLGGKLGEPVGLPSAKRYSIAMSGPPHSRARAALAGSPREQVDCRVRDGLAEETDPGNLP